MGAKIEISGRKLVIDGIPQLIAVNVHAHDLRAAAALLIASAAAKGKSCVSGLSHLRRGYQDLIGSMQRLGVSISSV